MSYDDLAKLAQLRDSGAITLDEYDLEKRKILQSSNPAAATAYWGMDERTYCMLLHLSQLAGFIIPFAGIVMPIVKWVMYKDQNDFIAANGRHAVNWAISEIIYLIISAVLILVIIGIPLLIGVGICGIVFAILAAVKAKDGIVWKYPMAIPFISVPPAAAR
jgi:uncharacterized Tic20 family protein